MDILDELKKEIITLERLHCLDKIDYTRFLEIYNNSSNLLFSHGITLSEADFASKILEISIYGYRRMAHSSHTPIILKDYVVSDDDVLAFRNFVMRDAKLHSGDALSYEDCKELFSKYHIGLCESDFMERVLDVSNKAYSKARLDSDKKVWILRKEQVDDKYLQDLKRLIVLSEKLYPGIDMNYSTFKSIYAKYYTPLSESDFASRVLGISESNLSKIRNLGTNTPALEGLSLKKNAISAFKCRLMDKENLHIGELISYFRFSDIFSRNFFPLSEIEYAEKIFGIARNNFLTIKYNSDRKAAVFKDEVLGKDEIISLQDRISENYKIGAWIDMGTFDDIYNEFPCRLLPKDYAEQILSIPSSQFKSMRTKGTKGRISFREAEYVADLFDSLEHSTYGLGVKVNLSEFEELYRGFGKMVTMPTFAKILGIDYWMLLRGHREPILNQRIRAAKDTFRKNLNGTPVQFHTIEEMQEFCSNNDVSFDEFRKYILGTQFYDAFLPTEFLEEKGGCWYGEFKIVCSHDFVEKYTDKILDIANSVATGLCADYGLRNCSEEYAAEATLYIIEKCGDLERNYTDLEDLLFKKIRQRVNLAIRGKIIADNFKPRPIYISKYYPLSGSDLEIADTSRNVEDIVFDRYCFDDDEREK